MKRLAVLLVVAGLALWLLRSPQEQDATAPEKLAVPASPSTADVVKASPPPSQVATSSPPATSKTSSQEKFDQLVHRAKASIPTVRELRSLTEEEVHTTPKALIKAGAVIGDLAQAMKDDASLIPQGIEFYKSCAFEGDYPTPVRALCYSRARRLMSERGEKMRDEYLVPADVRELAQSL